MTLRIALLFFATSCLSALGNFSFFSAELDSLNSQIYLTCPFSKLPTSGHIPALMEVKNGTTQQLDVNTTFSVGGIYDFNSGIKGTHRSSISVPPGQTSGRWVMIPVGFSKSYYGGSSLSITATSNSPTSKNIQSSVNIGTNNPDNSFLFVAISESLFSYSGSKISSGLAGDQFSKAAKNESLASFNPKSLPPDPRAYYGVDLLLLTETEWKTLPSETRQTLTAWMLGGGNLAISKAGGLANPSDLGLIPDQKKSNSNYLCGLGRLILASTNATGKELNLNQLDSLSRFEPVMNSNLAPSAGPGSLTESIEGTRSNRLLLVFVLLAFAILVGPVNLFVFAPLGRRHRLFITTPLIALGTSLLLALGVVLSDGFGGEGSRVALVEISNLGEQHLAHITQEQAAHLGIVFGTDFTLEPGTSIKPFTSLDTEFSQFNPATLNTAKFELITEEKSEGLEAQGAWISSRSDVAHQLRCQRPDRGAVQITGGPDNLSVSHSLTYSLNKFYYRDHTGTLWTADHVPTGVPTELRKSKFYNFKSDMESTRSLFSSQLNKNLNSIIQQRNRFYAISSDFPMIETSDSIDWQSSNALITGNLHSKP